MIAVASASGPSRAPSTRLPLVALAVSALALGAGTGAVRAQVPAGWLLSGANADLYRMRLDREVVHSGASSMRLEARGNRRSREWAVSVQMIDAAPFRGGRIRLAGYLRSDDLDSGGLWMRIDGIIGGEAAQIAVDNAEDRRLTDDTEWTRQEIVLDVPAGSVTILYGAMIAGDGELWVDGLAIEPAGDAAPTGEVTNTVLGGTYERPMGMLPAPVNLDFELEASG